MGFLSKIYERRGKAQRQAGFGGFKNGAEDVSGKGTGATSGGSLADPPGSSPAARDFQARDASGPASAVPGDPQPKPRSTSRSRARSKPDPFDFETSRDAAVEEPPVSPSTRSPPSRSKPKPASRGGSPSPSGAARNKPSSSRSPGTASASPLGSPGTFGAARDAVPSPRDAPGTGAGRGSAEAAADPFLPTPGKRRRVTFAEVDAFTLDEEEDEDDVDVPAHGRRDRDPFDFPEDGDEDVALAPPPAATTTASRSPRPAWGVFGGSPATSPEARPKHGSKSTAVDSGLTAPSPEWAKRAPVPSRSRSASPMDADAPRSVEKKRNAPKQKPLLPLREVHFPHSPSAAMAMASPSPPPRIGGGPGTRDALPESSDALAALDEAQYALSGLGADQPEAGRLACASSLVSIAADARLRRALAQHGLAPRLCRAALDLCASVLGVGQTADGGGVIARALAAERRRAASPALGVSAAALLYLSTLELRAGEAAAVYAGRDVAGILAELMRRADFTAEEDVSAESRGDSKGARRRLLGETREDADAADETKNGNASSFGSGFGALLANGAETKALRTTRDALRNLKFLPHESVDAPTLALLAAHRALAQTERAAARASQRGRGGGSKPRSARRRAPPTDIRRILGRITTRARVKSARRGARKPRGTRLPFSAGPASRSHSPRGAPFWRRRGWRTKRRARFARRARAASRGGKRTKRTSGKTKTATEASKTTQRARVARRRASSGACAWWRRRRSGRPPARTRASPGRSRPRRNSTRNPRGNPCVSSRCA